MKQVITYLILFLVASATAQQTPVFTQYTFNKAGVNPAASGTDINQKYNYVFGINRQWVGFDNPPKTNFVNFSMTLRPPRSYHYWQNVSIYVDTEENGIFSNNGIYAGYTFHVLLKRNWVASFGVYAGIRSNYVSVGTVDPADPIFQKSNYRAFLYPDIIPGLRLSNKKMFVDLAMRQITTPKLKDFHGNSIGGPSTLKPSLFVAFGRKIGLSDNFVFMPSVALNTALIHYPDVSLNAMVYYVNRMGAGVALRNLNFLSFIYQIRILKTVTVGFAYSTSLNTARYAAPHSFEIMVGMVPIGMNSKSTGKHSVARCPGLEY